MLRQAGITVNQRLYDYCALSPGWQNQIKPARTDARRCLAERMDRRSAILIAMQANKYATLRKASTTDCQAYATPYCTTWISILRRPPTAPDPEETFAVPVIQRQVSERSSRTAR